VDEPAEAVPLLVESLALAELLGNQYGAAHVTEALGAALTDLGDHGRAAEQLMESVRLRVELDEPYGIAPISTV
jgi:hypothetical protein